MYGNEKDGTNEPICKAAKETQAQRIDLQTGLRGGRRG